MTTNGKRWFGYDIWHGRICPVLYHNEKPTDGNDRNKISHIKQLIEVPTILYDKGVTQLSLIYPYKEESKQDEKFKI